MRKHKAKIITGVLIALVLTFTFFHGGNAPEQTEVGQVAFEPKEIAEDLNKHQETTKKDSEDVLKDADDIAEVPSDSGKEVVEYSEQNDMHINPETGTDEYGTEPVPEGKPVPTEPEEAEKSDKELTCTLSVRCDTILKNLGKFNKDKIEILPENGVVLEESTVTFYEGESVFNLLVRELKRNKIHLEFVNAPIYNSAYIEGIANIYEFDCGELSGWMYKVNDWFPNYGCSRYQLKNGDKVEWLYTCDLGTDVGGDYSSRNGS